MLTDQERGNAKIVIVHYRLRDLALRSDQTGQIDLRAVSAMLDHNCLSRRTPCAAAASRGREPSFGGGAPSARLPTALVFLPLPSAARNASAFSTMASAFAQACSSVSASTGRSDRLNRGCRPSAAATARMRAKSAALIMGLTPQYINISLLARDRNGRVRRAAEINRNTAISTRIHIAEAARHAIILAGVVERISRTPFLPDDVKI